MENLGLSLSIASSASTAANNLPSRPLWPGFIPSSPVETDMPLLKGFDVNRAPTLDKEIEEEDEYAGVSSANSTVSSVSAGKRGQREESENGPISEEEDGGEGSRKKLRLSRNQSAVLEESFKEHNTLNPKQKLALAKQLNLRPRQVEVWFQNRRARTKLKQTEVDCEFLKRCCENLTDENRRLHKEVQELRALKLSPQFYMQMTPPTTLTMCSSCERVAVSSSSTSSASSTSTAVTAAATANPSQNLDAHLHFAGSSGINQQYAQSLQKPQQHLFFPMRVESPARRTVP